MALGAFATLPAELARPGVELISRNLEMAQLRQAVISGIWVEQAKAERVAALAMDDARVRAAEARAQAAEHALQAGPNRTGPTYRGPGPSPRRPGRTGAGRRPTRASRRPGRLAGGWRW
jgi:hypothetical protein